MTGAMRLDKSAQFTMLKNAFIPDLLAGHCPAAPHGNSTGFFSVACDRSPRTPTRFSARTLLLMTDPAYPLPHRLTVDDLDPETATTDALIAMVRRHRESEKYPTPEQLLRNLPVARRALCDHVLTGQTSALDVAYRLASIIDALEGGNKLPEPAHRTH